MFSNICLILHLKMLQFLLCLRSLSKLFHKLTTLYSNNRWLTAVLNTGIFNILLICTGDWEIRSVSRRLLDNLFNVWVAASTCYGAHIKMQQKTADSGAAGNCPATGLVQYANTGSNVEYRMSPCPPKYAKGS